MAKVALIEILYLCTRIQAYVAPCCARRLKFSLLAKQVMVSKLMFVILQRKRYRIKEKMNALQELIPNANKVAVTKCFVNAKLKVLDVWLLT